MQPFDDDLEPYLDYAPQALSSQKREQLRRLATERHPWFRVLDLAAGQSNYRNVANVFDYTLFDIRVEELYQKLQERITEPVQQDESPDDALARLDETIAAVGGYLRNSAPLYENDKPISFEGHPRLQHVDHPRLKQLTSRYQKISSGAPLTAKDRAGLFFSTFIGENAQDPLEKAAFYAMFGLATAHAPSSAYTEEPNLNLGALVGPYMQSADPSTRQGRLANVRRALGMLPHMTSVSIGAAKTKIDLENALSGNIDTGGDDTTASATLTDTADVTFYATVSEAYGEAIRSLELQETVRELLTARSGLEFIYPKDARRVAEVLVGSGNVNYLLTKPIEDMSPTKISELVQMLRETSSHEEVRQLRPMRPVESEKAQEISALFDGTLSLYHYIVSLNLSGLVQLLRDQLPLDSTGALTFLDRFYGDETGSTALTIEELTELGKALGGQDEVAIFTWARDTALPNLQNERARLLGRPTAQPRPSTDFAGRSQFESRIAATIDLAESSGEPWEAVFARASVPELRLISNFMSAVSTAHVEAVRWCENLSMQEVTIDDLAGGTGSGIESVFARLVAIELAKIELRAPRRYNKDLQFVSVPMDKQSALNSLRRYVFLGKGRFRVDPSWTGISSHVATATYRYERGREARSWKPVLPGRSTWRF